MANDLWELRKDIKPIVSELIEKYAEELGHVRPSQIGYVAFSKKKSKKQAFIAPVKPMYSLLVNEDYLLCVHLERWTELSASEKRVLIFHELMHIPEGGFDEEESEFRKTIDHDVQDFLYIIRKFGIDWENSSKILKPKDTTTISAKDEDVEDEDETKDED